MSYLLLMNNAITFAKTLGFNVAQDDNALHPATREPCRMTILTRKVKKTLLTFRVTDLNGATEIFFTKDYGYTYKIPGGDVEDTIGDFAKRVLSEGDAACAGLTSV